MNENVDVNPPACRGRAARTRGRRSFAAVVGSPPRRASGALVLAAAMLSSPLLGFADAATPPPPMGTIKVCKVAGPGVTVGTPYTFRGWGPVTASIPAGPAPGGYCNVIGSFPVGLPVTVDEDVPPDTSVAIAVAGSGTILGIPDLVAGKVVVKVGAGVTEVTFTNRRTGFIEICKKSAGLPPVTGTFQFAVDGNLYTVPVGTCTGPIELPLGPTTISEVYTYGVAMAGCSAVPGPVSCTFWPPTATVTVQPGGLGQQQIVTFYNRKVGIPVEPAKATGATVACSPSPAVPGQAVSCTVVVRPTTPDRSIPSGVVTCSDGTAANVVGASALDTEGAARVPLHISSVGTHGISCNYKGSEVFAPSATPTVAQVIAQPGAAR